MNTPLETTPYIVDNKKSKAMILYALSKKVALTKIRLSKILLKSDIINFNENRNFLTNYHYVKNLFGPYDQTSFNQDLNYLINETLIEVVESHRFFRTKNIYRVSDSPQTISPLNDEEKTVVEKAIDDLKNFSDSKLKRMFHDKTWKKYKRYEAIPKHYFVEMRPATKSELRKLSLL